NGICYSGEIGSPVSQCVNTWSVLVNFPVWRDHSQVGRVLGNIEFAVIPIVSPSDHGTVGPGRQAVAKTGSNGHHISRAIGNVHRTDHRAIGLERQPVESARADGDYVGRNRGDGIVGRPAYDRSVAPQGQAVEIPRGDGNDIGRAGGNSDLGERVGSV